MRLYLPSRSPRSASRSGVALIITIIMLSVITFLAVAFLALSGREKNSVKTATNQTTARLAAEAGLERAKAELISTILTTTNPANFGLLVSTNFINYLGFQTGGVNDQLTNVNYFYPNGAPLNLADARQNLLNLLYSPRVPVFITNRLWGTNDAWDFRDYLDLNRNGRHDLSGLWPEISDDPANPYYNTNGLRMPGIIIGSTRSNFMRGDPEWIGGLDKPNQPHGPENQFLYRYAYLAVPIGQTLDVNYIHNQALASGPMDLNGRDFFRNEGVGGWEINLAAFLYDLNTNAVYGWGAAGAYQYNPISGLPTGGNAFDDAGALYRYRLNGNPNTLAYVLPTVSFLYGATPFATDFIDGYSDGELLTTPFTGLTLDNDNVNRPWVGADNPNHFFTTQDFFDRSKVATSGAGLKFTDRLNILSTNASTYDSYTFYRLLEQLGTDSAPEESGKLNLDYVNIPPLSATNFIRWDDPTYNFVGTYGVPASVLFFTNAVDRLLRAYTAEWLAKDIQVPVNGTNVSAFLDTFQTAQPFGLTNIPVLVSNKFVYNPAIHRILQVAANLWETKNSTNAFPTVFRPVFAKDNDNNLYIHDFVLEASQATILANTSSRRIYDLAVSNAVSALPNDGNFLAYGVPLVIGAHKGLPNFNEFQAEPVFTITRKIELIKPSADSTLIKDTNQFFTMTLSMPSAAEFWNSYLTNYTRPVIVTITNETSFTLTNDDPVIKVHSFSSFRTGDSFSTANWRSTIAKSGSGLSSNYLAMMRTNIPFLPTVKYLPYKGFQLTNTSDIDDSGVLLMPRWGATISNRVHGMVLDQATGRIIDYVLLGNMTFYTNLTDVLSASGTWADGDGDATTQAFKQLWQTNQLVGGLLTGRPGVVQQIRISQGGNATLNESIIESKWKSFGRLEAGFGTAKAAIIKFNEFLSSAATTNQMVVPFSPSYQFSVPVILEANDPLVHYMTDDMLDPERSFQVTKYDPQSPSPRVPLKNIGQKNDRYLPWAPDKMESDNDAINSAMKDPGVTSSDMWQFPTNVLPTLGWLGRVHRGTPWQTVYLKAADLDRPNFVYKMGDWPQVYEKSDKAPMRWTAFAGNRNMLQSFYNRPAEDRMLFDEFTTVLNDNAARGRLSINQSGLAAWSAVFSGVAVLSNSTSPTLYVPMIIQPAGAFDYTDPNSWPPLVRIWNGINAQRARTVRVNNADVPVFPGQSFQTLGDILSVPELTDASPFLNTNVFGNALFANTLNDAAYEWLPQQVLGLLQKGEPRFVIYSYGQALQPAPDSIIPGGTYSGLCTNYAITAEVAGRAVVKMVGSSDPRRTDPKLYPKREDRYPPYLVTESFNLLGPD